MKTCSVERYIKTGLYTFDVGTDLYNTVQYGKDCHNNFLALSLILILLPNIVCAINSWMENGFKAGMKTLFLLHFITVMELWTGDYPDKDEFSIPLGKVLETCFESVPQFYLMSYILFLFGFGFPSSSSLSLQSLLPPVMMILGLVTSFLSLVHGINNLTVGGSKSTVNKTNILKCSLYTLPDILMRLLFFPIAWILLGSYTVLIMIFLILMAFVVGVLVGSSRTAGITLAMWINISPQVLVETSKISIFGKIISNTVLFFISVLFNIYLLADEPVKNSFIDIAHVTADFKSNTTNICNTPSSYQAETFIDSKTICYIFIPIIYICLFISSVEVFLHFFCREKWPKWREENVLRFLND